MADIYVSNSGADNNKGTQSSPLKSIQAALNKEPARILLKSGETFTDPIRVFHPTIITSYGNGNANLFVQSNGVTIRSDNVTVQQLNITANRGTTDNDWYGIDVGNSNCQINNNFVQGFFTNILVQKQFSATAYTENVSLSGNIFQGAWNYSGKSMGMYGSMTSGLVLRFNQWLNNGRMGPTADSYSFMLSHNVYLSEHMGTTLCEYDKFVGAGSDALIMRAGGIVRNCYFEDNPSSIVVGTNPSQVINNIIIGGGNITKPPMTPLGYGIEAVRTPSCLIDGNFIGNKGSGVGFGFGIKIDNNTTPFIAGDKPSVPAKNPQITISNNVVSQWNAVTAIDIELSDGHVDLDSNTIYQTGSRITRDGHTYFVPVAIEFNSGSGNTTYTNTNNKFGLDAPYIINENGVKKNIPTKVAIKSVTVPTWPPNVIPPPTPAPPVKPPTSSSTITSLFIKDGSTGKKIQDLLINGKTTVNIDNLPKTIRIEAQGSNIDSVQFDDGSHKIAKENLKPFDYPNSTDALTPSASTLDLTVTPIKSKKNGTIITASIVFQKSAPSIGPITSVFIKDAVTSKVIKDLVINGTVDVPVSSLPNKIRIEAQGSNLDSVQFSDSGKPIAKENLKPFDYPNSTDALTPSKSTLKIDIIPVKSNKKGQAVTVTVNFT